jgi:hypothetical protein
MSLNRIRACAALGLLILLTATTSYGEGPEGMQLFAPADVSTFGGRQEPNEGYFFQFDVLYWNISRPNVTPIGYPDLTRKVYYGPTEQESRIQRNTLFTSDFKSGFSVGNRFEFGRIQDGNGWLASIWQLRDQELDYYYGQADIVFNDIPFGSGQKLLQGAVGTGTDGFAVIKDLPVTLYNVTLSHSVDTWGGELMYIHRFLTRHEGGTFEFFAGARYLEFNDTFRVLTGSPASSPTSNPTPGTTSSLPSSVTPTVTSFLSDSMWQTSAQNHILGPQVGLRWFKQQGRWTLASESKLMAGFNMQNIYENVTLGPNLNPGNTSTTPIPNTPLWQPVVMGPSSPTYDTFTCEFSPAVELRLDAKYQITRYLNFRVGWTGFWTGGIARGDAVIDYTVNGNTGKMMGIDLSRNTENLFINGINLGFDFNR